MSRGDTEELPTFFWMILRKFELGDAGVDDLLRSEDDVFT